jgi:hypothetical protein
MHMREKAPPAGGVEPVAGGAVARETVGESVRLDNLTVPKSADLRKDIGVITITRGEGGADAIGAWHFANAYKRLADARRLVLGFGPEIPCGGSRRRKGRPQASKIEGPLSAGQRRLATELC